MPESVKNPAKPHIERLYFTDKPVRIYDVGHDLMTPVVDIAEALGISSNILTKNLKEHSELFAEISGKYKIQQACAEKSGAVSAYSRESEVLLISVRGAGLLILTLNINYFQDDKVRDTLFKARERVFKWLKGLNPNFEKNFWIEFLTFGKNSDSEIVKFIIAEYSVSRSTAYRWIRRAKHEMKLNQSTT